MPPQTSFARVEPRRPEGAGPAGRGVRGVLAAALLCGALGPASRADADSAGPTGPHVVVRLRPEAQSRSATIRLGDVADVSAADPALQRQLREVDLIDVTAPEGVQRLGRRFIDLRLQLAGFSAEDYELTGPAEVVLTLGAEAAAPSQLPRPTDASLEELARAEFSRTLHVPESDLRVTLSAPVMESLLGGVPPTADLRVDVAPRGQPGLGQSAMLVRVFAGERLLASRTAQFDVARQTPVLVAAVTLARGEVLTPEKLREERRFLLHPADSLTIEQVVGQQLTAGLAAGEIVQTRHVMRPVAGTDPPVIQARDPVRVTARRAGLIVVLRNAEALQSGRPGQLIRVRNPDTNQVIVGRVVAAGEVEVSFD